MIKFMRNVKPKLYPKFIRTILNFIRYHMLIRQIYYKDGDRELLAELMRDTADGFNIGVEHFWLKYHARHKNKRYKTRKELQRLSKEIGSELEDMQVSKMRAEKEKERQERIKKENEKRRRPKYVQGYKPTVNELLNSETVLNEMKLGTVSYKFYDIREKGAYVALILIENKKPFIFCGPDYSKVREKSFSKWLDLTKDQHIKPYELRGTSSTVTPPRRETQQRAQEEDFDINIGHVERAMGINPENNRINSDRDNDINDIIDGLF